MLCDADAMHCGGSFVQACANVKSKTRSLVRIALGHHNFVEKDCRGTAEFSDVSASQTRVNHFA